MVDGVNSDDAAKLDEWVGAISRFASELPVQAERLGVKTNGGHRRRAFWCVPVTVTAPDRSTVATALVAVDSAGGWRWVDAKGRDTAAPSGSGLGGATDPTYSTYESFQRFLSS